MKLYSKEQVMEAMILARNDYDTESERFKRLTPIELPSDNEIEKEAFQVPYDGTDTFYDKSFIKGAIWMKEQILNQNKQNKQL